MQLVARNYEYLKGLNMFCAWFGRATRCTLRTKSWMSERVNNVPCVVWSCIKMHATHEIPSDGARFLTRAISYQRVIGTRCEVCAIKCPENKSAVDFPSVFNTSKIHRTFFISRLMTTATKVVWCWHRNGWNNGNVWWRAVVAFHFCHLIDH